MRWHDQQAQHHRDLYEEPGQIDLKGRAVIGKKAAPQTTKAKKNKA